MEAERRDAMSKFLTGLDARLTDKDSVWILDKSLVYESDLVGIVEVPEGFYTDLASVPRIPIAYEAFGGRAHREAIIHDYLYRIDSRPVVSFMTANKVFLEAMKVRGKGFFTRHAMYLGVCAGGIFSFHKKNVMDEI
jgi:hypothetical protein